MVWKQLIAPAALAIAGAGTLVAAQVREPTASRLGTAAVWIEAPSDGATLPVGQVMVSVHATADDRVDAIELVDGGKAVGRTAKLTRSDKLVYGAIAWDAAAGSHELRARQIGGAGATSPPVNVTVGSMSPDAASATTPVSTSTAPSGPTTSSSTTTSVPVTTTTLSETSLPPSSMTPAPPSSAGPGPAATLPPATRPPSPPTTTRPAPPVIDSATFSGPAKVYAGTYCPAYTVEVQARIREATTARVVSSSGWSVDMAVSGSTWRATIPSGQLPAGSWRVEVQATNAGGTVTKGVGVVEVGNGCPKD